MSDSHRDSQPATSAREEPAEREASPRPALASPARVAPAPMKSPMAAASSGWMGASSAPASQPMPSARDITPDDNAIQRRKTVVNKPPSIPKAELYRNRTCPRNYSKEVRPSPLLSSHPWLFFRFSQSPIHTHTARSTVLMSYRTAMNRTKHVARLFRRKTWPSSAWASCCTLSC